MRRRRPALLLLVAAASLLLTGCRVGVRLSVDVDDDGSGVVALRVTLDDEAAEAVGPAFPGRLRLDDLVEAGWDVDAKAGELTATKTFATPAELAAVVGEVAGPFRDFALQRDPGRLRTSFDFSGRVDLRDGAAGALDPDDPVVRRVFADEGLDVGEIRAEMRRRLDDALAVEVRVALPGEGPRTWEAPVGRTTDLEASSAALAEGRVLLLGLAVLLGVAGLTLVRGVGVRRRRRPAAG